MSAVSNEQLAKLLNEVKDQNRQFMERMATQDKAIETINERTSAMDSSMEKIKLSLIGSETLGLKGIVNRVDELEQKEKKRSLREAKIAGAAVIVTGILAWLKDKFLH